MKALVIVSTICVLLGVLPLPYGFYMLLRLVITLTCVAGFLRAREDQRRDWLWIYGILVVLYNPILPVHLMLKSLWFVVNVITIILLWVGLSKFGSQFPKGKRA